MDAIPKLLDAGHAGVGGVDDGKIQKEPWAVQITPSTSIIEASRALLGLLVRNCKLRQYLRASGCGPTCPVV